MRARLHHRAESARRERRRRRPQRWPYRAALLPAGCRYRGAMRRATRRAAPLPLRIPMLSIL